MAKKYALPAANLGVVRAALIKLMKGQGITELVLTDDELRTMDTHRVSMEMPVSRLTQWIIRVEEK